jgi:hypothetical protein
VEIRSCRSTHVAAATISLTVITAPLPRISAVCAPLHADIASQPKAAYLTHALTEASRPNGLSRSECNVADLVTEFGSYSRCDHFYSPRMHGGQPLDL